MAKVSYLLIVLHFMILLRIFAAKKEWGSFVYHSHVATYNNIDNSSTDISKLLGCYRFEEMRKVVVGLGLQALRYVSISAYGTYILHTILGFHIIVL